jgi:hypothetical protein
MEVSGMTAYLPTFISLSDFFSRLFDIFRGPMFITVFKKINPVFREKLLLTVSMANNCAG